MKYRENFRASSELSALLDSLHLPTKLQEGVSSFPSNYTIKVYKTIENKGDVELQLVKFHKIFDADPGVITCMNVFEANHSIVLGMDNGKTVILKVFFDHFFDFFLGWRHVRQTLYCLCFGEQSAHGAHHQYIHDLPRSICCWKTPNESRNLENCRFWSLHSPVWATTWFTMKTSSPTNTESSPMRKDAKLNVPLWTVRQLYFSLFFLILLDYWL